MKQNNHSQQLKNIIDSANTIILGKEHKLRLALTCILAKGHLLIEDLPGVGKTTLAHTMAQLLGLEFSRIQFTSDMLPADVLGISIFEQNKNQSVPSMIHIQSNLIISLIVSVQKGVGACQPASCNGSSSTVL